MNILVVTGGYSIFDAKGQLNGFLAHLTEKNLVMHLKVVDKKDRV